MEIRGEAKLLRIFISSTDKFKHEPLYEVIIYAAKRYGLSGGTVLRGVMGFGAQSNVHSVKFWELTEKVPLVVEIVDEATKIESFSEKILPWLKSTKYGCLVTIEKADIVLHKL
jgi:uncharacterized protein